MNLTFFNQLIEKGGFFGIIIGVCILAIATLFKLFVGAEDKVLEEKDKAIQIEKEFIEKVILVLTEVNNTEKAIMILLEKKR